MVTRLMIMAALVLVVVVAGPVTGQEDMFSGLPTCTNAEVLDTLTLLQDEFLEDYQAAIGLMEDLNLAEGTMLEMAVALDALQIKWWSEMVPEFPICAGAARLAYTGGRMLDELLISGLQAHFGYGIAEDGDDELLLSAAPHIANWSALQSEMTELIKALDE